MSRPKKGERGCEEATRKWRETMFAKYGGKECVSKKMAEIGAKGGRLSKTGGFASDKVGKDGLTGRERSRIAGSKGGKRSSRKNVHNGEGKRWQKS